MADLFKTNLVLVASPLPANFRGTPQEYYEAFVERLEIQSPVGTNFFVVGDIEPSSDQGPWLRGGTQWWVFSSISGNYIPLDITASLRNLFTASAIEPDPPGAGDALIWLQTAAGRVVGWYFWNGTAWTPSGNPSRSGPTASRPTEPEDLEQYFDTDINCLIHWERGAWRTVAGTPQDVKKVITATLADALRQNPGWEFIGTLDQSYMGAVLGVASKDPDLAPGVPGVANFATDSGITPRAAGDYVGEESHTLTDDEIAQHSHIIGVMNALGTASQHLFYRVDDGESFVAASPRPPNYARIPGGTVTPQTGTQSGELTQATSGTMLVSSKQLDISAGANYNEAAVAHNTMQPTWFLWTLYKL